MYSRAQRGLWLNYSRRKYFDRNGSGASSTAAFIITSCSWLLIANDIHYFFWWQCCSSRVPNGITEVTFVTAISAAYTFRTRYLHWRNLAAWNDIMRTIIVRTFRFIFLALSSQRSFPSFFFAAYVSKDQWSKQTIETDKSTSVNYHVLDKPLILLSQLEFQQGLIIS